MYCNACVTDETVYSLSQVGFKVTLDKGVGWGFFLCTKWKNLLVHVANDEANCLVIGYLYDVTNSYSIFN